MLKYGNKKHKTQIINILIDNVVFFATQQGAAVVFEYAFSTYATNAQRNALLKEFIPSKDVSYQVKS